MVDLSLSKAEERAPALLKALRLPIAVRRVRGRYLTSPSRLPGVSYWATSMPRFKRDGFGVQFEGAGLTYLGRLKSALARAGFNDRGQNDGRHTFERELPFAEGGRIDEAALAEAKRAVDDLLAGQPKSGGSKMTFLEFMEASPLYGVELDIPPRTFAPERPVDLAD
jgi:hypothetical protein